MTSFQLRLTVVLIAVICVVVSVANIYLEHSARTSVIHFSDTSTPNMIQLTNKERSIVNEVPLREDRSLDIVADKRAMMLCDGYFSHDGWQKSFVDLSYNHVGENIARNYDDASSTNKALMESPDHRANILDAKFSDIGLSSLICGTNSYGTDTLTVELFGGYN